MERATKLIVFGWALTALVAEVLLVSRAWNELLPIAVGLFVLAALLAVFSHKTIGFVLAFAYVFPVLVRFITGMYSGYFSVLWMAPFFGALAPACLRTPWRIPTRWRGALVCWALVLAVGSPIVIARELDFNAALLNWPGIVWSSVAGAPGPVGAVTWVLYVSLVSTLGILWFDWLFGISESDFLSGVAAPLLVSCSVMAVVAIYQMFVSITFLNETVFGGTGRASGTLFDANLCGMIAALWIGGAMLATARLKRWRVASATFLMLLNWFAVWGSGSRTAFAAALLISLFILTAVARKGHWTARAGVAIAAATVITGLFFVLIGLRASAVGPVARVMAMLPPLSLRSLGDIGAELWNRNGYGAIAMVMIRRFPGFGVGIGAYQIILPDISQYIPGGPLPPDNAQNWYRHQIAELGLVGSLGWVVWIVMFGAFVLSVRPQKSKELSIWTGRGMLLAFASVSLLGMPGQDIPVIITFWAIAYWFVCQAGNLEQTHALSRRSWLMIVAIVVVYGAGTTVFATTRLRVPHRAQDVGWAYSYGFYDPEPDPAGGESRWTAKRAAVVMEAPTRWIKLRVSANHADIAAKPLDVKVWCDGKLAFTIHLENVAPVTRYVFIEKVERWVFLETSVNRVVRPSDFGALDDRELGVRAQWSFVTDPSPEAGGTEFH